MAFEYSANELDVVESFWTFTIPEQNIIIPFLLVGRAREPDITMDRSHMNFKALLIGKCKFSLWFPKAMRKEDGWFHYVWLNFIFVHDCFVFLKKSKP